MDDIQGRPAAAHPVPRSSGLVAGIGVRAVASAADVLALIDASLARVSHGRADIRALTTIKNKADHPALRDAARTLGVPILAQPHGNLAPQVPNPSNAVAQLAGLPSVAEAAALVFGPLVLSKQRSSTVTCALARYAGPQPSESSSASRAASTLLTSRAGP